VTFFSSTDLKPFIFIIVSQYDQTSIRLNLEEHYFEVERLTFGRVPSEIEGSFRFQNNLKCFYNYSSTLLLIHHLVLIQLVSYPFSQLLLSRLVFLLLQLFLSIFPNLPLLSSKSIEITLRKLPIVIIVFFIVAVQGFILIILFLLICQRIL